MQHGHFTWRQELELLQPDCEDHRLEGFTRIQYRKTVVAALQTTPLNPSIPSFSRGRRRSTPALHSTCSYLYLYSKKLPFSACGSRSTLQAQRQGALSCSVSQLFIRITAECNWSLESRATGI